jgi:TPR repeat protein
MRRLVQLLFVLAAASLAASAQQLRAPINPTALFEKGMNALTGTGFSRNDLSGVQYIRQSADAGYAPAQAVMGYFAEIGFSTPPEPEQAATYYTKAAAQGDRLSAWVLGRMYFTGIGEQRNLNEAERWLSKAANQGDAFGAHLLGSLKLEKSDYAGAAAWFRKAAEQGLPQAQQQLGSMLKEGKGIPVDKFEACVWLLLSFEAGNQSAAEDLKRLETDLTSQQIEQAKSRVREFQGTNSRVVVSRGCTGWAGEFNPIPATPPADLQAFCR